jgi:hypothetical protein
MDDQNMNERSLSKQQWLQHQHCESITTGLFYKEWQKNLRFTFSVGDTAWAVSNKYWARQIELVTLRTMFSVVVCSLYYDSKGY